MARQTVRGQERALRCWIGGCLPTGVEGRGDFTVAVVHRVGSRRGLPLLPGGPREHHRAVLVAAESGVVRARTCRPAAGFQSSSAPAL